MAYPPAPWKVLPAGSQWAITRAKPKRDDDDICHGSQFIDDWQDLANLLAGVPRMAAYIRAQAAAGDAEAKKIARALKLEGFG